MASLGRQVRDELVTWASGLGLSNSPTITARQASQSDGNETLPSLHFEFTTEEEHTDNWPPEELSTAGGVGVLDFGSVESQGRIVYRCASEAEAETFREEFRRKVLFDAMSRDASGVPWVVRWSATLQGQTLRSVDLAMDPTVNLYGPRETQVRDLWIVTRDAHLEWPLIETEETGSGTQDVVVDLEIYTQDGTDLGYEAPPDTYEMNDYRP